MSIYNTKEFKDSIRVKSCYEWKCEWCYDDQYQDIIDYEHSEKVSEVWPPKRTVVSEVGIPVFARLVLVKDIGSESNGLIDRGHAYFGDAEFDNDMKVPKKYLAIFESANKKMDCLPKKLKY